MFDLDFKSALEPVIFFRVKSQCEMNKEFFGSFFRELAVVKLQDLTRTVYAWKK